MTTRPQQVEGGSVNAVKVKQGNEGENSRKHYNCGREGHLAKDRNCPAKGRKFWKESVYGMTILLCVVEERVMVMKIEIKQVSDRGFLVDVNVTVLTLWGIERHLIERRTAFTVSENQEETCNATTRKEPVIEVSVNGITTKVIIDSGSVSSLMRVNEYEELKAQGFNARTERCYKRLYVYGGRALIMT